MRDAPSRSEANQDPPQPGGQVSKTRTLTGEQIRLIRVTLSERLRDSLVCPLSKDSDWEVQSRLAFLPAAHSGTLNEVQLFPSAVLLCNTCGYLAQFNLFKLGITEQLGLPEKPV